MLSLVRVTRFELVYPLWKSGVLPLNDTRVAKDAHYSEPFARGQASARGLLLERVTRFELVSPLWESGVVPLNDTRVLKNLAIVPGPFGPSSRSAAGDVLSPLSRS